MRNLFISIFLFLSTPAYASFGFYCETSDKQVSMYIIDYSTMLNIQSITINGEVTKSDELATNFYLGSILAMRIMDDQLTNIILSGELRLNSKTYVYEGPVTYLNSAGKKVVTQLNCESAQ